MKIGFFCPYGVGDALMTFKALYVIKHIYKAELIFFGKSNVKALMQNCDFVDEFVSIGGGG